MRQCHVQYTHVHEAVLCLPSFLPLQLCAGYVHYLEQEVTRLKLANRLVKSAEPAREVSAGAASHERGREGQGDEIVQQALLAAMKADEGTVCESGWWVDEVTQWCGDG